ncbi:polysaccharide deacetylase [Synergistales bacterium]|nr:polysaccharide deacetylase [Synergistales bacterium]
MNVTANAILNAFTVDLEDWFCVSNMEQIFPVSRWSACPLRIDDSANSILRLLEKHGVRATFFVLGWIAEHCPSVVRRIYEAGHEIGVHGYGHARVTGLNCEEFRDDMERCIESVSRVVPTARIAGYRAPSFSITLRSAWALDVIASFGLRYDSSVFPAGGRTDYGWSGAARGINRPLDNLIEVPITPWFGGGYFRLFPYRVSRHIIKKVNKNGLPAIFYIHPWEVDPDQTRVGLPLMKRFRHYVNLDKTLRRLDLLLSEFSFGAIGDVLDKNGF